MASALLGVGKSLFVHGSAFCLEGDQRKETSLRLNSRRRTRLWCCNAAAPPNNANNPDSRPELWKDGAGYHPLEEVTGAEKEDAEKQYVAKLSGGEVARTIAEVNSNAILLSPALSQSNAVYGTEVLYLVDEHGDIYLELADNNDVLHSLSNDPRCSLIIGFGELNDLLTTDLLPTYENHLSEPSETTLQELEVVDEDDSDDSDEEVEEEANSETEGESIYKLPNDVHPLVFASKLSKVAGLDVVSDIFKPSMRLAITGVVRNLTEEEEPYARRIWEDRFLWEDDESSSDDAEGEAEGEEQEGEEEAEDTEDKEETTASDETDDSESSCDSEDEWSDDTEPETSLYRIEIHNIQIASDLGAHATVTENQFKYAEADVLAHSADEMIERLNSGGKKVKKALRNLCNRDKGVPFEEVVVIGIDSLGIDVRASRGTELKTMRFPFARRARCSDTAQVLIHQLLHPRSRHKK